MRTAKNTLVRLLVVLTLATTTEGLSFNKTVAQKELLGTMMANYDKKIRPYPQNGGPTSVTIDIYINSLSELRELDMEYKLDLYLRQRWNDPRLAFLDFKHNDTITLPYDDIDNFWLPDLFISNSKRGMKHDISVPNKVLWVSSNGSIVYSQRLSLTMNCILQLQLFPGDNQTCSLVIESYGYRTTDLVFSWTPTKKPVELNNNIELPEFELLPEDTEYEDCTAVFSTTGAFTCIKVKFHMQRSFGYYLFQIYIPSILIVVLSWLSFFIDVNAAPARVSIGLLTVLTITTQSSGVRSQLPRVAYTKAIDVWMAACLLFVALAFFEYAIAANKKKENEDENLKRNSKQAKKSELLHSSATSDNRPKSYGNKAFEMELDADDSNGNGQNIVSSPNSVHLMSVKFTDQKYKFAEITLNSQDTKASNIRNISQHCCKRITAHSIDVASRFIFPISFIVFNLIYWLAYFV